MSLLEAIRSGDLRAVRQALGRKSALKEKTALGESALHVAAAVGKTALVRLILDHGGDLRALHYRKETPLHVAAGMGHRRVVELFLEHGANPRARDVFKRTPLHHICAGGGMASDPDRAAIVKALLDAGVAVDGTDSSGRSPLWNAANRGRTKVVKVLLNYGADPELAADGEQGTPYDAAVAARHSKVAALLGPKT